jgi:hypothetical protein
MSMCSIIAMVLPLPLIVTGGVFEFEIVGAAGNGSARPCKARLASEINVTTIRIVMADIVGNQSSWKKNVVGAFDQPTSRQTSDK